MPNWRKYRSEEEKRKRAEKASRAARARWDAYHAAKMDEPEMFTLPQDCYRLTIENLIHNKTHVFLFHPAHKSGCYDIDLDGVFWKRCGFTECLVFIRKLCKRGNNDANV